MKKEKMELRRLDDTYNHELVEILKTPHTGNLEAYNWMYDIVCDSRVDMELDLISSIAMGIDYINFGIYPDIKYNVTDVKSFIKSIENESQFDYLLDNHLKGKLNELKIAFNNGDLKQQSELIEIIVFGILNISNDHINFKDMTMLEILNEESDHFGYLMEDLNLWYDIETKVIYTEYELEDMGIDVYELED